MDRARTTAVAGIVCLLTPLLAAAASAPAVAPAVVPAAAAFPGGNGRIAFVSDREGQPDLYVMDPDGGNVTRLTDTGEREDTPAWSPDGTRLAYAAGPSDDQDIFVISADGSRVTRLTDSPGRDYEPAWSPDGSHILFTSDRGRTPGSPQVYVMSYDGSGETLVGSAPIGGSAQSPTWAPTGDRIAYAWNDAGVVGDSLFVAAADGSDPNPIPRPLPPQVSDLDWSPNGSRIAFAGGDGFSSNLYDVDVDRFVVSELTENGESRAPSWSPDGQLIAFTGLTHDESSSYDDVWIMDADGSDPTALTADDDTFTEGQPTWQAKHPPTVALTVTPGSAQREVGQEHTLVFTPLDASGTPVVGQGMFVRVTGPHPQTATIVSRSDGKASLSWVGTGPGTDTVIACADDDGNAVCGLAEPLVTATVLWVPPAEVEEPRLAFTDDADALYAVDVARGGPKGNEFFFPTDPPASYATALTGFEAGPKHVGEAGGSPDQPPAFVSTRDDPNGEVYLASASASGSGATRVTCDPGTETHPVMNESGEVAYASDADGDWDIYVSSPPPVIVDRPATGRTDVNTCSNDWTTTNVTDAAPGAEDLWPTWTPDRGLVFSRAEPGGLSDLYSTDRDEGGDWQTPIQLTATPQVAESQPAATRLDVDCAEDEGCDIETENWVAFTTSQFQSAGTLAFLSLEDGEQVNQPRFAAGPASEPAWTSIRNEPYLAFTSTADNPYGAIAVAAVTPPTELADGSTTVPQLQGVSTLGNGRSGIGESHPFFLRDFGTRGNDNARLVFTSRSSDEVLKGSRILDADVSDVVARDGSQRRAIRHQRDPAVGPVEYRYDEAGPSYSPDGRRLVYSRDARPATETVGARLLMVANADGTDPALLLPPGQRQADDLDIDPAWSPDGTKIAFVRIRGSGGDDPNPDPPQIWVFNLTTGVATPIKGPPEGADLSPSWAPDSQHLVVSRTPDVDGDFPFDSARRWGSYQVSSNHELFILDAADPSGPGRRFDTCDDGCGIDGRTPAWSPDGSRIAYEEDGELQVLTLPTPCCTDPVLDVADIVTLTGFDFDFGSDGPTPSMPVISAAHDPAWSPDGSEIAFAGQPAGQPDQSGIWGIAPDGTGLRPITDERGPESEPVYQPSRDADVAVTVAVANTPALVGHPVSATFTVTNNGPLPATEVTLVTAFTAGATLDATGATPGCHTDGTGCGFAVLAPGESRTYQVSVRHTAAVLGTATGTVGADTPDPVGGNNTASAPYRFQAPDLQVRVGLDEEVGYVGGPRVATVSVRNLGSDPVDDVELTATWSDLLLPSVAPPLPSGTPACLPAGNSCNLGTIAAGEHLKFRVALEPLAAGTAPITVKVKTSTPEVTTENNKDRTELQILQPTVRVLPSVGPPGHVVLVYGESMPPGSLVSLDWQPGINLRVGPFRVSKDGTVRVPLLIVRHDQIGTRLLIATSSTALFTPVDGVMLVVPRTLVPPNFNGRG